MIHHDQCTHKTHRTALHVVYKRTWGTQEMFPINMVVRLCHIKKSEPMLKQQQTNFWGILLCVNPHGAYSWICTIFRLHIVYQNHHFLDKLCTNRAQICRLRTLLPDSFSQFVKCAPLAKTQQAEEVSGGFWTSFLVDFFEGNNLTQSYFHINHQHLLCTGCSKTPSTPQRPPRVR